jgi:phosphotransferase system  glucose/maltose/N-acetylglucosamine-specific IIC component
MDLCRDPGSGFQMWPAGSGFSLGCFPTVTDVSVLFAFLLIATCLLLLSLFPVQGGLGSLGSGLLQCAN